MNKWVVTTLAFIGIAFPMLASAQNCKDIDNNSVWMDGITAMKNAYDNQNYEDVLDAARPLYAICPDVPSYLYYIARAFEGKGDVSKAREYIYKASESTYKYATSPQMSQLIWYARYEIDNPEQTKKSVEALKSQNESLNAQVIDLKGDSSKLATTSDMMKSQSIKNRDDLMMGVWIGTGIGGVGVITLATGIGLLASELDNPVTSKSEKTPKEIQIHNKYIAGWTVLGVGSALAVAGAIVAGIYGYQYTHLSDDVDLSFQISPASASLNLTF